MPLRLKGACSNIWRRTGNCLAGFLLAERRRAPAGLLLSVLLVVPSPVVAQESTMVIEASTGEILYSYEEDIPFPPASLTKMMTIYLAFDALQDGQLQADQPLAVSANAAQQPPSRLGLTQGTTITAANAILALITKSANDAAVVLAEALSGSEAEFAKAMTEKARLLGMANTVFLNASGLHQEGQLTTARDMSKLAMGLQENHPDLYKQFSIRRFSWRGRSYANHNPLLASYEGADGIKTGYVKESGYNLVGSAERNGVRIIAVALGSKTPHIRNWAMTTLLDYGFQRMALQYPAQQTAGSHFILNPLGERAIQVAVRGTQDPPSSRQGHTPPSATTSSATSHLPAGTEGDWAIQVGAYPSVQPAKDAAISARTIAPELLGEARMSFPVVTRGGSQFYRARLTGLTEASARSACRKLANSGLPCMAVNDGGAFTASLDQ
jgi:D-alanyl-D-alanine carboxypeptidase